MSRPIGHNIVAVCQALEAGPRTTLEIKTAFDGWDYDSAYQFLKRALKHNFVSRTETVPHVYTVVPHWRELVDKYGIRMSKEIKPKPKVLKPRPVVAPYTPKVPTFRNSVFDVREFA